MESKTNFALSRCCSLQAPPPASACPDSTLNELAISFTSNDSSAFTENETRKLQMHSSNQPIITALARKYSPWASLK